MPRNPHVSELSAETLTTNAVNTSAYRLRESPGLRRTRLALAGLGYVGLPLAVEIAPTGLTFWVEIPEHVVSGINAGRSQHPGHSARSPAGGSTVRTAGSASRLANSARLRSSWIVIPGIAFKKDNDDNRESPALEIIRLRHYEVARPLPRSALRRHQR